MLIAAVSQEAVGCSNLLLGSRGSRSPPHGKILGLRGGVVRTQPSTFFLHLLVFRIEVGYPMRRFGFVGEVVIGECIPGGRRSRGQRFICLPCALIDAAAG
jgi:hypothetical protein